MCIDQPLVFKGSTRFLLASFCDSARRGQTIRVGNRSACIKKVKRMEIEEGHCNNALSCHNNTDVSFLMTIKTFSNYYRKHFSGFVSSKLLTKSVLPKISCHAQPYEKKKQTVFEFCFDEPEIPFHFRERSQKNLLEGVGGTMMRNWGSPKKSRGKKGGV